MRKSHFLILGFILLIGLLFRTYQVVERFEFAHDGDLYSWIVKDIVINHHFRLLGQLTSAPGIFIGPLFYYLLVPFFLLTRMDPIGVILFATITGLLTIFSYYFVFSKLYKIEVGLIAAFLYSTLISTVNFDRWVVPTITSNLWVIWYFYTVIKIVRGDYRVLPLLGILIGLIWHVHIALVPALIAVPISIILSKSLPKPKQIMQFFISCFITSLPLFIFEVKHNFQQFHSLIINFAAPKEGATGLYKLILVLNMIAKNINSLLFAPQSFQATNNFFFILIILFSAVLLVKKKLLLQMELLVFLVWILGVVAFFGLSSSPISEYYFSNIEVIFICIFCLYLYFILNSSKIGKIFVVGLLLLIAVKNGYFIVTQDYYHKGYLEKKAIVNYIEQDIKNKGYPCIGISYITSPGENVGFRYLLYLKKIHLVHPSIDVPVYNIVIPDELSQKEAKLKFGHIGVIPPKNIPPNQIIEKNCQTPDTNLTDSVFGYVD